MTKYIQEIQNKHSCGHEQREKRPYLVIYENNIRFVGGGGGGAYVLGFPLTTKNKQTKSYPSHTNPQLSIDKLDGEVMLDQLQFIYKKDFTNLPKISVSNTDYQVIIDSFVSQIIKARENPNKNEPNCPSFCDIISFAHNIPEFSNINKWLVVSSKHFNVYAKMCFIAPYKDKNLDFAFLHSIDWQARDIKIQDKLKYTKQHIQALQQAIKNKFNEKPKDKKCLQKE